MVGRLVEQQRRRFGAGVGEQDARQFDAPPLAAGQRAPAAGRAPDRADRGSRRYAPPRSRPRTRRARRSAPPAAVAAQQSGVVRRLGELHLCLGDVGDERVEPASGQHPVAGEHLEVAGARVLREVADRPGAINASGVRQRLAGEHTQACRLAGAVAPDEPDAVSGLHAQRRRLEQDASAGAQLEVSGSDHQQVLLGTADGRAKGSAVDSVPERGHAYTVPVS